jgi:hypothetical protein
MHINRNVVKIVASALLMVSLPAGAQVLGGNLGGTANGTLGGTFGRTNIDGATRATGNASVDASGAAGAARDRADRIGGRAREVGAGAAGTARSRVASTRGAADSTVHTAHSVGVDASQRTVDPAARARNSAAQNAAAQTNVQPNGGLLVNGSGAAATEQRAMGRSVSAESAAAWEANGDRSGLTGSAASQTDASVNLS